MQASAECKVFYLLEGPTFLLTCPVHFVHPRFWAISESQRSRQIVGRQNAKNMRVKHQILKKIRTYILLKAFFLRDAIALVSVVTSKLVYCQDQNCGGSGKMLPGMHY